MRSSQQIDKWSQQTRCDELELLTKYIFLKATEVTHYSALGSTSDYFG